MLASLGWVWFRAETFTEAGSYFRSLVGMSGRRGRRDFASVSGCGRLYGRLRCAVRMPIPARGSLRLRSVPAGRPGAGGASRRRYWHLAAPADEPDRTGWRDQQSIPLFGLPRAGPHLVPVLFGLLESPARAASRRERSLAFSAERWSRDEPERVDEFSRRLRQVWSSERRPEPISPASRRGWCGGRTNGFSSPITTCSVRLRDSGWMSRPSAAWPLSCSASMRIHWARAALWSWR